MKHSPTVLPPLLVASAGLAFGAANTLPQLIMPTVPIGNPAGAPGPRGGNRPVQH